MKIGTWIPLGRLPYSTGATSPKLQTGISWNLFFEGTNISEGRGTTKPFEQIGAPFIDAMKLADILNDINLAGVDFDQLFHSDL